MKSVIGIDEVGRGPVAGPTAVCALRLAIPTKEIRAFTVPLRDSKKLTQKQRELWYTQIGIWQKDGKCDFSVTMISAKIIDTIGITPAIRKALAASLLQVAKMNYQSIILLDGGLKAPCEFKNQKTFIKGDEKYPAIALASIVAKVTRDRYMQKQAKKFPEYGFETHVGYGTRKHYVAIKKYGLTPIHRRSFLKNI
jgi:ribonuclease HII